MIYGFQKTTLVDFPGEIACTIFTGGCNLRCPWCHNLDLVIPERLKNLEPIPIEEVLTHLNKRKGLINGVVVSGGEPSLWGEKILSLIEKIKQNEFLVKIDTNGTNPDFVKKLIEYRLVDYIAMDIKAPWDKYEKVTGVKCDLEAIKNSLFLIKNSGICHQFRTTLHEFITLEEMEQFAAKIGVKLFYQPFVAHGFINKKIP